MKIAYLILAHNTPSHMARLVRALNSPNAAFFVHIDRKSDISPFQKQLSGHNITFLEDRVDVYWGDVSDVEATIKLIKRGLSDSPDSSYFVLLSGSDYPLRGPRYIEDFLSRHRGSEFINLVQMPCDAVGKPIERLENYWLRTPFKSQFMIRIVGKLNHWNTKLKLIRRDYLNALKDVAPYAGSQWWALTVDVCRYILAFVHSKPEVVKFFNNVLLPDESFFQTIIGNSEFAKHVTRNLTFTDWSRPTGGPAIIDRDHLDAFVQMGRVVADDPYGRGELLFARKFMDNSSELTDFIDAHLINRHEQQLADSGSKY
jgi:hypothetical protein